VGTAYQTFERTSRSKDKELIVGAGVKFGDFEVKANYMRADLSETAVITTATPAVYDFEQANIGAAYTLGANKFFANIQRDEMDNGAKGTGWSVGYTYSLSKRTNVYAAYATMRNNNRAAFGVFSGATNVTPPSSAPGADPKALSLGVRHSF
jgi:predicted porin